MPDLFVKHESRTVRIRLPLPPSANAYWRSFIRPGCKAPLVYVSDEGKAFQKAVRVAWEHGEPLTGRLRLTVWIHAATRRACDLDNRIKSLQDALNPKPEKGFAGAWLDDSQIDELHVYRGTVAPPAGYCDVMIEVINQ